MHKYIMANPPMEGIRNRTIKKETYMQKSVHNHTISWICGTTRFTIEDISTQTICHHVSTLTKDFQITKYSHFALLQLKFTINVCRSRFICDLSNWSACTSLKLVSACMNSITNIKPEHWASIPKVVGSISTVARHIFQACPVWIYTQSNITNIIFTWVQSHQHSEMDIWKKLKQSVLIKS